VVTPGAPTSRRRLLEASLAASAAAALAGCGANRARHRPVADPVQDQDVVLLNDLLARERHAIAAYTAGIPLLGGTRRHAAVEFLRQELAHAGMLLALIKDSGGGARPRAASYDLGQPQTARDVLLLLHEVERAEITGYLDAIPRMKPGRLRAAAATILADDAQHVSVLRSELGLSPTPAAFVTGAE
jgi:Ferritin-like domain